MNAMPFTKESLELLQRGCEALAVVESNGLRIDVDYLQKAIRRTERKIGHMAEELVQDEVAWVWRKTFGRKMNFSSTEQLGNILFEKMGFKAESFTETGKPKTDEKALGALTHPFVKSYLKMKKLEKANSTYLKGLLREVQDGFIHPFFNLHLVQTYRSSSSDPNFQNLPIRDEEMGKLIRTAFLARPGHRIVEIDGAGIEVRIAACYHKDPVMISYIEDETKDMHRDMAMQCYMLKQEQVGKKIRYCGKNMFVFPQFYGDWYIDCARSLWEAIGNMHLVTEDGIPLKEHLQNKGIFELGELNPKEDSRPGTFEHHIKLVERDFWEKRFSVYNQWRKSWFRKYEETGWFLTKTGFICQGVMKRNEVINYPVQGSAFHWLLWCLTQLLAELKKRNMKTLIIGQIHDSIVADVPDEEMEEYLVLAKKVMCKMVRKFWPWIIVPIDIEAEATPVGGTWAEKKGVVIPE